MTATDIISIASARDWLSAVDDTHLERNISSAINWVEIYTGYTLVTTEKVKQIPTNGYGIRAYPIDITSVKNGNGETIAYNTKEGAFKLYVFAPRGSYVHYTAGYDSLEEIPSILVDAAYKMLTYINENRDIYEAKLPLDIQMQINKLRRNIL